MNDGSRINSFEKFLPFIIFVLVFISYIPSLQNGFVDWDDSPLIIFNYDFRGLGLKQIKWMFSTFHMSHYQPLSWLSLALDYCVWGLNPFGYHLTNIVLHSFSAALLASVSSILLRMSKLPRAEALFGAAFAAMFWAAHPLRAESVSWITERRDVLSTALFMLSLFLYVNVFKNNSSEKLRIAFFSRSLIPCFAVYVMSCLSKSMAVTLPAILLIIDFYPLKRLNFSFEKNSGKISFLKKTADFFKKNYFGFFSAFCEKIPFFAFAAAFSFFYYFVVGKAIDVPYIADYMPSAAKAIYAYWFYLWKTILPIGLSPVYVPPQGGYLLVNSVGGL
ncbi:MAG: hypothetical protein J5706_02905, partial [Elusimicrobiales bacterium]|nr:hypothetical protein [Elusimicrobiales bacterium]